MRKITREMMRGKPLDADCKKYGRSDSNQFGPGDNRCYCTGIWNRMYDEYEKKCYGCKAFNRNAAPLPKIS